MFSCDQLVQHRTERKQIAPTVQLFAARLFRRHVRDGADRSPRTGQEVRRVANRLAAKILLPLMQQLGETEIQNLDGPALDDTDIGWLDVTVHNSFFVRGVQRIGELNANLQNAWNRQRCIGQQLIQRLPLQQFHGDEGAPLVLLDGVNGANSRMVQRGGRARLAYKSLERDGVFGLGG